MSDTLLYKFQQAGLRILEDSINEFLKGQRELVDHIFPKHHDFFAFTNFFVKLYDFEKPAFILTENEVITSQWLDMEVEFPLGHGKHFKGPEYRLHNLEIVYGYEFRDLTIDVFFKEIRVHEIESGFGKL